MQNEFGRTKQKDGGDSQHVIRSRLRGTKSLDALRAMAAESARLEQLADIEKPLSESVRSTVEEYRRQGISRSTAPDLRSMTESQILLEALSRPDWLNRLQENGIKVNKPTLELISQKLNEIRMKSPMPSDFNPAARNFNETSYKLEGILEDIGFTALRVELAGLKGGVFHAYSNDRPYARIMTLKDPNGEMHVFNTGELSCEIANFTARWIGKYGGVNGANCLTEDNVNNLGSGKILNGWTCTRLTYISVKKGVYLTDKGTPIYTLLDLPYKAISKEDADKDYPDLPHHIEDPTPSYNCHSLTFLNKDGWFIDEDGSVIQTILDENEYHRVANRGYAQVGDIAVYYLNGIIEHTALVRAIDDNRIMVDSKMGPGSCKRHEMSASQIVASYGEPTIYHTNREGGHTLLRVTDDTDS